VSSQNAAKVTGTLGDEFVSTRKVGQQIGNIGSACAHGAPCRTRCMADRFMNMRLTSSIYHAVERGEVDRIVRSFGL
jgi:hypothetical protein